MYNTRIEPAFIFTNALRIRTLYDASNYFVMFTWKSLMNYTLAHMRVIVIDAFAPDTGIGVVITGLANE